MEALKTVNRQLEKALTELKEVNNEENQLIYDYVEYANSLVKNLILSDVSTHLLRELRKHYLVEIDFESRLPKADIKTIMSL